MTAHNLSSGRSCERTGPHLFLECVGGAFGSSIDPEYFVHVDNTAGG